MVIKSMEARRAARVEPEKLAPTYYRSDRYVRAAVGERIRHWRTTRGLSQTYLAESIGVKRTAISQWELGNKTPSLLFIYRMAAELDIAPTKLLA